MMYVVVATALVVAFEDFKWRAIHWFLPVIIFLASLVYAGFDWKQTITNTALISMQFSLLALYVFIKTRRWSIFKTHIGVGDLVFFLAITPLFELKLFILVLVSGYVLALLVYVIGQLVFRDYKEIPLAGCAAIQVVISLLFPTMFEKCLLPFFNLV